MTIFPVSIVHADSSRVATHNLAAEQYVQDRLLTGEVADLAAQFPNKNDRVISGDFLSALLLSAELKGQQTAVIRNAVINGDLNAQLATLPFNLSFDTCQFDGSINLSHAETGELKIENSNVSGFFRMDRATVNGDLALESSTFQNAVGLSEINVDGDLIGRGSQFLGTRLDVNMDYPFELYRGQVKLAVDFSDATIAGKSIFDNSHFDEVHFTNAIFLDETSFSDASVETNSLFDGTTFEKNATFDNFSTGNYADFTDATFKADATFDFSTFTRFLDFAHTTFDQNFSFYYVTAGWVDIIYNTNFNGPVNFEGMHITENFEINDSQYNYDGEPFDFYLVNVEGAAWLRNFDSPAGINASYGHFTIFEFSTDTPFDLQTLDISSAKIGSEFFLENVSIKNFLAEGLSVGQSTTFNQVDITETLDLRNAGIGHLRADQFKWPNNPSAFYLHGMSYTDIDLGEQGLSDETWQSLLQLVNQSAYSPQAYQSLSQFLKDKGHADWAGEVDLAGKRRERDETMSPLSGPWFWSWFLDIFIGYGHRPFLAFLWSGLVIFFGAFIYWKEEDMVILDTSDARPVYNPIFYSFALFIPFIELDIASKWDPKPSRKFASYYKHLHRILGWVLMPIALLTFGGIIG